MATKVAPQHLKQLDPAAAPLLAANKRKTLRLPLLQQLTPEAASCLAKWKGTELSLDGLTSLAAETAKQLAKWKGRLLFFRGLRTPDEAIKRILKTFSGVRYLRIGRRCSGAFEGVTLGRQDLLLKLCELLAPLGAKIDHLV